MTSFTIGEIASALDLSIVGDADVKITGVAEPLDAKNTELALAMSAKFLEVLPRSNAKAALVPTGTDWQAIGLTAAIFVERPRVAMAALTEMLAQTQEFVREIHDTALIDPTATIQSGVSIGAFTTIGPGTVIGQGTTIASHVTIGAGVVLGQGCVIHPGVRIRDAVIGDRLIAHGNVVIGGDGFSFVTAEPSGAEKARESLGKDGVTTGQPWIKIHSLGGVQIGDDVEIGASSTIDQGTIRPTKIGNGTKLDSQVQVGHNVVIGEDCLLCAQVGIAGSTVIGSHVVLGGQSGVADNLIVGDRVIAGGGTKILSNAPTGRVLMGYPAVKMETNIESYKALRRLPRLMADVKALKKLVAKLGSDD